MINIGEQLNKDRDRCVKKWTPVIDNLFSYKNKGLIEILWLSLIETQLMTIQPPPTASLGSYGYQHPSNGRGGSGDIPDKIRAAGERVDKYQRVRIIGKAMNPLTGVIEWELENGEYIPVSTPYRKLNIKDKIQIFGDEFVKDLYRNDYIPEYRDTQLNDILRANG